MPIDEFDESLFENPFVKAVKKLEKDRESLIAEDHLREEKEKKAREEEYAQRIIQAEKILREDCLEAIHAIPPLELGKSNSTSFTTEAFLWFSEPGPLVRTEITEFTLAQSWLESLKAEGIVDENAYSDFDSKHQAFRALSGRIFSDANLDIILAEIRKELGAAKMKISTMDGITFEIRWHR